jgi:hypothetical protein
MRIYTVSSGIDFTAEEQHLEKHVYPVLHAILRGRTRLSWVSSLPGDMSSVEGGAVVWTSAPPCPDPWASCLSSPRVYMPKSLAGFPQVGE